MAIVYGLKVNLSVALVAMLNHTELNRLTTPNHTSFSFINNITKIANLTTTAIVSSNDVCSSGSEVSATIEVIYIHEFIDTYILFNLK